MRIVRRSTPAIALLAVVLAASVAEGQTRQVTGKVTMRETGQPVPDATVGIVGIPVGARTNERGEYRLNAPAGDVTLMTRMIGYKRQQRLLPAGQTTADFQLEKDVLELEGVTVTGAATSIERRNATSAVSQVNAEQLARVPAVSIENALQGKVLGASINMNNGAPGGGGQIQIRGPSSLLGRIDPLIVLDGVIISNDVRSNSQRYITSSLNAGEENGTNRLSDINPNDIESVEMLKGSVASAIYGSQATNGVVVITTKRGRSGSPRLGVSQRLGMYSLLRSLGSRHFKNADEVLASPVVQTNEGEAAVAANCTATSCPYYDYVGELYGRKKPSLETNMSLSGGIENTKYFVSINDRQEAGIATNTGSRHQSLRTNVDQTVFNRVTISLGGNILRSFNQRGISNNDNAESSPLYGFAYTPGVVDLRQRDAQGNYVLNPFGYGPLTASNPFQTFDLMTNNEDTYRMIANSNINYAAWNTTNNDLRFTLLVGIDKLQNENFEYAPATIQFQRPGTPQGTYPGTSILGNGDALLTNSTLGGIWQFSPSSHFLRATTSAGLQYAGTRYTDFTIVGRGLIPSVTTPTGMANTIPLANRTATITQAYYVQEELLTFNERLYLSAALRGEKASVNGDRGAVYTFPRFGASYRFVEPLPLISELKLRATVGQSGNQPRYGERDLTFSNGGQIGGQVGLVQPTSVGNATIKPERQTETEAGFDLSFWRDRAHFEATYFNRSISDLLVRPLLAPSSGIAQTVVNGGKMRTAGSEIGLTLVPIETRNISWTSRTNFQQNISRIVSFPPGVLPFRLGAEGGFGTAYGRLFFSPGQKTTSIYGNAVRADGSVARDTILGDANPKFLMGFGNDFTWGNFTLGTLLDWRKGGTVSNLTLNLYDEGRNTWDYMKPSPDPSVGATLGEWRYEKWGGGSNTWVYLDDGSFVKIREITLSYDVPRTRLNALQRFGVSSTRLSLSGRNLYMWTKYNGYDPEVNNGGNVVARFVDNAPFPPSRSFFLTVDLGF